MTSKFYKRMPHADLFSILEWSSWEGQLAMVNHPNYAELWGSGLASPLWFDPERRARRYEVHMALDIRTKKPIPVPDPNILGTRIEVNNPNIPLSSAIWTWRDPLTRMPVQGTFTKPLDAWVQLPLKKLGVRELRVLEELWREQGYIDMTGERAKSNDLKKLLSTKSFYDSQDLDPDLANIADRMLTIANRYRNVPTTSEEKVWSSIRGVYAWNKARDKVLFVLSR